MKHIDNSQSQKKLSGVAKGFRKRTWKTIKLTSRVGVAALKKQITQGKRDRNQQGNSAEGQHDTASSMTVEMAEELLSEIDSLKGLVMKLNAPLVRAKVAFLISPYPDITAMGIRGLSFLLCTINCSPSISGIIKSLMIRSTFSDCNRFKASEPLEAVIGIMPNCSTIFDKLIRISSTSSIIRITCFMGVPLPGVRGLLDCLSFHG